MPFSERSLRYRVDGGLDVCNMVGATDSRADHGSSAETQRGSLAIAAQADWNVVRIGVFDHPRA